jgi:saccharopine dehydrogenase-like NADP-dependent oxidoreductase
MKVLVLGGGGVVGRRVVEELGRHPEVDAVVVSGRRGTELEHMVHGLSSSEAPVTAAPVDVTDPEAVAERADGADVAVSCAGPFLARDSPAARGAIQAGVPYVSLGDDLSGTRQVLDLGEAARAAGVTVVTGCGFSPGITGLLVALAARETQAVEDVEISVATSLLDARGRATAVHFLSALAQPASMVFDHKLVQQAAASSPRLVFFPEPIGWVETFRCEHPEVVSLLASYPEVRSLQSRIGLEERAAMDLARVAARTGMGRSENLTRTLLRLGAPLRPALERVPPRGARQTGIRVDVHGRDDGRATTTSFAIADRFVKLAALPVVQATIELGTRRATKPGVHTPDRVFEPSLFLRALLDGGLHLMRLQPTHL